MDIVVERNGLRLVLMPAFGGCVRSFTWLGRNILFPAADPAPSSPLETAAFPLFPFSGRINEGRFRWNGRDIRLEPNFPPEPHAIHGQAWHAAWDVDALDAHSARLTYRHEPDSWPWAYLATQDFRLTEDGLELTLSLTNLSDEVMPAGLGWHPYFPRGDARLSANVSGIWVADSGMIPDRLDTLGPGTDVRKQTAVAALNLDNAFAAHPANAEITWPSAGLHLSIGSSPELGHLVVFVPEGKDFFCVEPVSHAPDAVNSAHERDVTGLRSLEPGETLTANIVLKLAEADG